MSAAKQYENLARWLEDKYKLELLEKNGYKLGDIIKDRRGNDCIITGVDKSGYYGRYYLKFNKIKKDGTPSKHGGFLNIPLNED